MKVLVVGASGRTGKRVVQEARAAGHTVRALARSLRAEQAAEGLEVLAADVCEPGVAERAVAGMDAVIVALSMVRTSDNPWARITTPLDLHTQAAARLLGACEAAGVRRYVSVSAHGVGDSRPRAGWFFLGLVHSSNIGIAYNNLAEAEARVNSVPVQSITMSTPRSPQSTFDGSVSWLKRVGRSAICSPPLSKTTG